MTDKQKALIGSAIRTALVFLGAVLVRHKIVSDGPLLGMAIDDTTAQVLGWIMAGGGLGWSQIRKLWDARNQASAQVTTTPAAAAIVSAAMPTAVLGLIPVGPAPTVEQAKAIVGDEGASLSFDAASNAKILADLGPVKLPPDKP